MYDRILLPTDGSDASRAAAAHAGRLAQMAGATVQVLSVADTRNRFESPSSGVAPDVWREAEEDRAEAAVAEAVADLPDGVPVDRTVVAGVPHAEILSVAEASDADVLVMGTHGRTGLDHYLVGSVAERVVRRSPIPVLTVRDDGADD